MSLSELLSTDATIVRRTPSGARDAHGNRASGTEEIPVRCSIQKALKRGGEEPDDAGEFSDTDWMAYLPIGTELGIGDAIRTAGGIFEVVGQPWEAKEGSSAVHHVEAPLRRTAAAGDAP